MTMTMRNTPVGLPIIEGSERLIGSFPYFVDNRGNDGEMEFYSYGSFENYEDVNLVWDHDRTKIIASRQMGNLKIWEADAALNFLVNRGGSEYNHVAFEILRHPKDIIYGLSPCGNLYGTGTSELAGVIERKGVKLIEFSVVPRPVNEASVICYFADVDMKALEARPGPKPKLGDVPKYVSTLSQDRIDELKRHSPRFKRALVRGYETTMLGGSHDQF